MEEFPMAPDDDQTAEPTSTDEDDELTVPGLPDGDDGGHPITEDGEPMPV
jgi:hypothetical protein